MKALERIAFDWGVRCFGIDHMSNKPIRALRLLEEAIELAQSLRLPYEKVQQLVDTVYRRPPGNPLQELGGVLVTSSVLCTTFSTDLEQVFETEIRRCLAKSPEEFARRNQDKLDLGLSA